MGIGRPLSAVAWSLLVFGGVVWADPPPLHGQLVVRGRVLSTAGDVPIPQAGVSVVDSLGVVLRTAWTSSTGVFRVEVDPEAGPIYVQAQALGFLTFVDGPLPAGIEPLDVVLRLQPRPFVMDSLTASVERRSRWLEATGFYDRASMGFGYHVDRDWMARRPWAPNVAELFRTFPGVSVDNQGGVRLGGPGTRARGDCPPAVYIDGVQVESWAVSRLHPTDVDGIEVYRRSAEVPAPYSLANGCGVILVWLRR